MKGLSLPEDWQPTNLEREYGHGLGLSDTEIDDMAEDMRLWAGANEHRQNARKAGMKGWSMAFKGWMRRGIKSNRGPNNGTTKVFGERLTQQLRSGQATIPPRPSLFFGAGNPSPRLLPEGQRDEPGSLRPSDNPGSVGLSPTRR